MPNTAPATSGKIHAGTRSSVASMLTAQNTARPANRSMPAIFSSSWCDQSSSGITAPTASIASAAPAMMIQRRFSRPRTSAWPKARHSTSHAVLEHTAATTSLR